VVRGVRRWHDQSAEQAGAPVLRADWRVMVFSVALTLGVMGLFGLAPALRAPAIIPAGTLKVLFALVRAWPLADGSPNRTMAQ
jgi:hypothetical protein